MDAPEKQGVRGKRDEVERKQNASWEQHDWGNTRIKSKLRVIEEKKHWQSGIRGGHLPKTGLNLHQSERGVWPG